MIIRIGTGIYPKTRKSSMTGSIVPAGTLEALGVEALRKLRVSVAAGAAAAVYNAGTTTPIPGVFVANTARRRISRRISIGGRTLQYENNYGRAPRVGPGRSCRRPVDLERGQKVVCDRD